MDAKMISIVIAIIFVLFIFLVGIKTELLRETSKSDAPYSFSRVQLWLWTIVIAPCFSLNWGFKIPPVASINNTSLALLGISIGVASTAIMVASTQAAAEAKNPTGITFKANQKTNKWFIDILADGSGQLSITRLQQLVFTCIYIAIYLSFFFTNGMKYPDFDNSAFTLMGISTGGYVLGKALNK